MVLRCIGHMVGTRSSFGAPDPTDRAPNGHSSATLDMRPWGVGEKTGAQNGG